MIGQKNLLARLKLYTLDTFPRSSIIVGGAGCGKHTLVREIGENVLHLPVVDLTGNISNAIIDDIYRSTSPALYCIEVTALTEKEQNSILKFVEEPLANAFVVLLAVNTEAVLSTIFNRCIRFDLEPYSSDELRDFIPGDFDATILLNVIRSPGKLKECNIRIVPATINYAQNIACRLQEASYPNTLSITQRVNFKDEYDKFDLEILLNALAEALYTQYMQTNAPSSYKMYKLLLKHRKGLMDKRLNKECWLDNLLTALWLCSREDV